MTQAFASFRRHLRAALAEPLPGRAAQYQMAPQPRPSDELPYDQPRADTRRGGVLVLFYPHNGQLHLPLILRPTYNGVHSGQVGLPGGGFEEGDGDLTQTALREAYEEVGVPPDEVTVLGQLSPLYIYASNYLVHPNVAWTPARPAFKIDPYEVALLLEAPLAELLDPGRRRVEAWQLRDRVADVPFFLVQGHKVWGATAMMLSELLALSLIETGIEAGQPTHTPG